MRVRYPFFRAIDCSCDSAMSINIYSIDCRSGGRVAWIDDGIENEAEAGELLARLCSQFHFPHYTMCTVDSTVSVRIVAF
jgi:hypothetical protein